MIGQPVSEKVVQINISQVPEERRNDPRFQALLAEMRQRFLDPKFVHAICVHEAAHAFFLGCAILLAYAETKEPSAIGPRISYNAAKDEFNVYASAVKFEDINIQRPTNIPTSEFLRRIAAGYAAGGVAARILANSCETGDDGDRENSDHMFAIVKRANPSMTVSADEVWVVAQRDVEIALQNTVVSEQILLLAESLKPELFPA